MVAALMFSGVILLLAFGLVILTARQRADGSLPPPAL